MEGEGGGREVEGGRRPGKLFWWRRRAEKLNQHNHHLAAYIPSDIPHQIFDSNCVLCPLIGLFIGNQFYLIAPWVYPSRYYCRKKRSDIEYGSTWAVMTMSTYFHLINIFIWHKFSWLVQARLISWSFSLPSPNAPNSSGRYKTDPAS